MKKITIKVTQVHIDNGIKRNCNKCPIALAVTEYFGASMKQVDVGIQLWLQTPKEELIKVKLPQNTQRFIKSFDSDSNFAPKVKPFEFEIEV